MKKVLLTLALPVCLVMGQDQPELPGWGVYIGYGMMGASVDEDAGDLETISAPGFGVSKGLMLGGLPLQVGLGIHPRGYKSEFEEDGLSSSMEVKAQYLDVWAQMPYPVGPAFLVGGVQVGTQIGGSVAMEFMGVKIEEDLEPGDFDPDFGVNFGLGMPVGDTGAQVGVLYLLGLAEPSEGLKWNGLFFNLGYSF